MASIMQSPDAIDASASIPPTAHPSDPTAAEPRFEFGRNWAKFLELLDEDRLRLARESLQAMLGVENLAGKTFLDIGSGSGLFSLSAQQLGAASICSFDYDEDSVGCTRELKQRFSSGSADWMICQGDCLDEGFMNSLPRFDVVYAWGVLHHTGSMWRAIENAAERVRPGGLFFLSIYNDQRWMSRAWRRIKRFYNRGWLCRWSVIALFVPLLFGVGIVQDLLNGRNPIARYARHHARGMSMVRDWFDWLGGYPFEVARADEVFRFCRDLGFTLRDMKTVGGGWGCNEFVLQRPSGDERPTPD